MNSRSIFLTLIAAPSVLMSAPFCSARPEMSECACGLFASGEFLYWKAKEEGLAYALQSPSSYATDPTKGAVGKISRIQPHFEPGYRVGLNYAFPRDQWDLCATWTSYTSTKNSQISPVSGAIIWPYFLDSQGSPVALSTKAKWRLQLTTLDVNLGRAFFLGEKFSIKPFAGFKAAWIGQKLTVDYLDVEFTSSSTPGIRSKNRNRFNGYGMDLGALASFRVSNAFSLFGKFSTALLSGNFSIAQFESDENRVPRLKLKDSLREFAAEIEMQGGVAWEKKFYRDRLYVNLYAAFEEQVWFHQNQLNRLISSNTVGHTKNAQGDLSLAGVTIGATLGF